MTRGPRQCFVFRGKKQRGAPLPTALFGVRSWQMSGGRRQAAGDGDAGMTIREGAFLDLGPVERQELDR